DKIKTARPLLLGLAVSLFLIYALDGCIIRALFSIPCPACGLSRAWLNFFSGKIDAAFYYHPLFFLAPILIISALFKNKKFVFIIAALFAFIYFIRLCFFEIP
ncbi:MAG: DUF2752 domain-containing protein, partial [Elusimicrobiota bacterium]|nr:DUF2752 domain-containing protein [Elusimicrobiota bacterium]